MTTTQESFEDVIAHYGKKGMKWGVRNADKAQGKIDAAEAKGNTKQVAKQTAKRDKALAKADEKWEKTIYTAPGAMAVHNAMADHFNSRITSINDRHPLADMFDAPDTPETKAYVSEVEQLQSRSYAYAVTTVHGASPSGRKKAVYVSDEDGHRIEVKSTDVEHAEADEPDLVILLRLDASGHIVEANKAEEAEVSHTDMSFEDSIAHYGKKGMKWGVTTVDKASSVRKTQDTPAKKGAKEITVSQKKAGRFVKSKGGERHKATEEAVKAQAARQKAKKSTTDSLTNDELKAATERMRLEQEFNKLERKTERQGIGQLLAEALFATDNK